MVAGLVGMGLLTILYLAITDPLVFVALRFIEGIAAAGVTPPARAILADTIPEENRGEAYGIFGAALNAGFLLGPAAGGLLGALGYAPVFLASAAVRLGAAGVVLALVRPDAPTESTNQDEAPHVPLRALFTLPLVAAYILVFGDYLYLGFDLTFMPIWMKVHLGATVTLIGLAFACWAVPNILLSPLGGRLADRVRRWRLILVFGLAQVPFYFAYAYSSSVYPVMTLFAFHGAVYAMLQPAVDAHLATFSPPGARARAQGVYSSVGFASAFLAANVLSLLYGVNFRLPLLVLAAGFGLCVVAGGLLVRVSEARLQEVPVAATSRAAGAE